MRVSEVMSGGVRTIGPGESADAAFERMRAERIHHLVVLDGRTVAGVVSERDLGGRRGASVRAGRSVRDLMTRGVVAAAPDDTVRQAANRMRGSSVGCLPVLDRGRLVGILTVSDLLDLIGRGVERPVERSKRFTLRRRAPPRR